MNRALEMMGTLVKRVGELFFNFNHHLVVCNFNLSSPMSNTLASTYSDGLFACLGNSATIGSGSCISDEKTFEDVDDPLDHTGACQENIAGIGDDSCIGFSSCSDNTGDIEGPNSW